MSKRFVVSTRLATQFEDDRTICSLLTMHFMPNHCKAWLHSLLSYWLQNASVCYGCHTEPVCHI